MAQLVTLDTVFGTVATRDIVCCKSIVATRDSIGATVETRDSIGGAVVTRNSVGGTLATHDYFDGTVELVTLSLAQWQLVTLDAVFGTVAICDIVCCWWQSGNS